jgi:hypothetical protein
VLLYFLILALLSKVTKAINFLAAKLGLGSVHRPSPLLIGTCGPGLKLQSECRQVLLAGSVNPLDALRIFAEPGFAVSNAD